MNAGETLEVVKWGLSAYLGGLVIPPDKEDQVEILRHAQDELKSALDLVNESLKEAEDGE